MQTLKRSLGLWWALTKNSFIRGLEFRVEFIGRALVEIVWMAGQVMTYAAAFRHAPSLGGWTQPEMWFFIGTMLFADGLYITLLYPNQNKFGEIIRNGQFDFYLLYPVSSLFLSMFRFVNVHGLINIALGVAVMVFAFFQASLPVNWALWTVYVTMGIAVVWGLGVLVTSAAFWTIQNSNLMWLFFELYRLGFRPESFYTGWLRRILLSVFPAAFFFSIPVQLALGKLGGLWFVAPFVLALVLWGLVALTWRAGVRRFEGALS